MLDNEDTNKMNNEINSQRIEVMPMSSNRNSINNFSSKKKFSIVIKEDIENNSNVSHNNINNHPFQKVTSWPDLASPDILLKSSD